MWSYFRLIDPAGQNVLECKSIDFAKGMIRALPPGRYTVEQISTLPSTSHCRTEQWGVIVKLQNGRIIDQPYPKES